MSKLLQEQDASRRKSSIGVVAVIASALFALCVVVSALRIVRAHQTPGPFDPARQGYCDFQNGVYFPSMAFRQGVSPYSPQYAAEYPVAGSTPFFSPIVFAVHLPFSLVPLPIAEVLYFFGVLAILLLIAHLVTRWLTTAGSNLPADTNGWRWDIFAVIALALIATRGGQQTVFTGYFTFELILATLVAVHYGKTKPWISAVALIFVSAKPNYVLPIALLMLSRGNLKAVVAGGIMSATLAACCFAWILPEDGLAGLVEQIEQTQAIHRANPVEKPVNSWVRVDALAIYAKWTEWEPGELAHLAVMLAILVPCTLVLAIYHRSSPDDGRATGLSGGLVLLSSVVSVYHHVYDALVVVSLAAALAFPREPVWSKMHPVLRTSVLACLLIPGLNYLSSQKFLNAYDLDLFWHQVVTSLNGLVLLLALIILLIVAAEEIVSGRRSVKQ